MSAAHVGKKIGCAHGQNQEVKDKGSVDYVGKKTGCAQGQNQKVKDKRSVDHVGERRGCVVYVALKVTGQRDKGPTDHVSERRDFAGGAQACCCCCGGGDCSCHGDVRRVSGGWLEAQGPWSCQLGKLLRCQHQLFGTCWKKGEQYTVT